MYLKGIFKLILITCTTQAQTQSPWESRFLEDLIVPDVIEAPPKRHLRVLDNHNHSIELGSIIKKTDIELPLKVDWNSTSQGTFHALFLLNPDVPSRQEPLEAEWQHWTVLNVPGKDLTNGDTVVDYSIEYKHPRQKGLQRLVLVAFLQNGMVNVSNMIKFDGNTQRKPGASRGYLHVKMVANGYEWDESPSFGTFFYVQSNDSVELENMSEQMNLTSVVTGMKEPLGQRESSCTTTMDCQDGFACNRGLHVCSHKDDIRASTPESSLSTMELDANSTPVYSDGYSSESEDEYYEDIEPGLGKV